MATPTQFIPITGYVALYSLDGRVGAPPMLPVVGLVLAEDGTSSAAVLNTAGKVASVDSETLPGRFLGVVPAAGAA